MTNTPTTPTGRRADDKGPQTHDLHEYAGGYITAHEGVLPIWLLFVYFGLFGWACYYILTYWGESGRAGSGDCCPTKRRSNKCWA